MVDQNDRELSYVMSDADLGELATTAPLRNVTHGKVDIGGRIRVASILRSAGITGAEMPVRIAGSTNEVWRAGNYIVRVSSLPGSERLRREAKLAGLLGPEVHYPTVVAAGSESFGEWMIVRHRPGVALSQDWTNMDEQARRSVVDDLGIALKSIHEVRIDGEHFDGVRFPEGTGALALPYQFSVAGLNVQLDKLRAMAFIDDGLIGEAEDRLAAVSPSIPEDEHHGLVHGDLHFENILVKNGVLVALLDFEWSREAPREIDIDVLARFCDDPQLHVGGTYPARREDYQDTLRWLCQSYPELFEHPRLSDRLTMCALAFEIPSLMNSPMSAPAGQLSKYHPVNRLRLLLSSGSHAERLGWGPKPPSW